MPFPPPAWTWVPSETPMPAGLAPSWQTYVNDPDGLINSGDYASLGVFRLLRAAIEHRAVAAGLTTDPIPEFPEVVPPDDAAGAWEACRIRLQEVIDAGFYHTRCGQPVVETIGALWPASVPAAISILSSMRFKERETVLEVDGEIMKVAEAVRENDTLATWPAPRFKNGLRLSGLELGVHDPSISLPAAAHCSTSSNVQAAYLKQAHFFIPEDGGLKPAVSAGSGTSSQSFTLESMSEVPPNGYEDVPPPPNCDYEYFLVSGSRGTVPCVKTAMTFNEKTFYLDGEHMLDVTPWIRDVNTVSLAPWIMPGDTGPPPANSWGGFYIMEMLVWREDGNPPAQLELGFRTFNYFGMRPWRNDGKDESASFVLTAVVEAFRNGPLAPLDDGSYPFPRADVRPRFVDPGDVVKASFLAFDTLSWSAVVRYGVTSTIVGGGVITGEVTTANITIPNQPAPYYTLEIRETGGSNRVIKDTIIGSLGRQFCAIHSYEPPITVGEDDIEQPGIICQGDTIVHLPVQGLPQGDPFSFHGRFRLPITLGAEEVLWVASSGTLAGAMRAVTRNGTLVIEQLNSAGSAVVASAVSNGFSTVGDTIFDLTVSRLAGSVVVYLNGDVLSTNTTGNWGIVDPNITDVFLGGHALMPASGFNGRIYRFTIYNTALSSQEVAKLPVHAIDEDDRWGVWETDEIVYNAGAISDLDFTIGVGGHFPDRSFRLQSANSVASPVLHIFPTTYGFRSVTCGVLFTPNEVWLFDLPPHCAVVTVEFEVLYAVPSGTTFRVGTNANPTLFTSHAINLGLQAYESSYKRSFATHTPVYLSTAGAVWNAGYIRVRVVYEVRG